MPVIEIEKIGDGPIVPFASGRGEQLLKDIRVLDFTHVLAGPRSARTLGEYGADVLHISSPAYPDTLAQHLGVDVGKRCAYLDLNNDEGLAAMKQLAHAADVFVMTYRHDVNSRFQLLPHELVKGRKKGMVCMTVNAYGHDGPWFGRPGFDQNGQVASGFAVSEGRGGKPRFSPVFYLADLITGYFAAAGMMAALLRRAVDGGSYHVKLSLARSAMWVQELGLLDVEAQTLLPEKDIYPADMFSFDSVYGQISQLKRPLQFSNMEVRDNVQLMPYGAGKPEWLKRG